MTVVQKVEWKDADWDYPLAVQWGVKMDFDSAEKLVNLVVEAKDSSTVAEKVALLEDRMDGWLVDRTAGRLVAVMEDELELK